MSFKLGLRCRIVKIGHDVIEYRDANNERHRTDGGPAYSDPEWQSWWIHGVRHRENGAAVVVNGQPTQYWLNGSFYTKEAFDREIDRRKQLKNQ